MANKWFETVAIAQRRAKRHLPKSVYGALVAGAEADNRIAGSGRHEVPGKFSGVRAGDAVGGSRSRSG